MLSFLNDYSEGCHPRILAALSGINLDPQIGYGKDDICARAADRIRRRFACPDADVHFLMAGTQTNLTAICAFLRAHEAPICADTGHINVHETGAVEATGHKILTRPAPDGKLTPAMIRDILTVHTDEHMVRPRLVYISQSTELGTVYSLAELEALHAICSEEGLLLYMDGARLACGLDASDVRPEDLPRLCDAFYLGGTKNGVLFGEALVIVNPALKTDFRYYMKRQGGMLAKGWLLGLQFDEILRDDLWFRLGHRSNTMAQKLQDGLKELRIPLYVESPTNQIFPILPDSVLPSLSEEVRYEFQKRADAEHSVVRFVCSWATEETSVDALLSLLKKLINK